MSSSSPFPPPQLKRLSNITPLKHHKFNKWANKFDQKLRPTPQAPNPRIETGKKAGGNHSIRRDSPLTAAEPLMRKRFSEKLGGIGGSRGAASRVGGVDRGNPNKEEKMLFEEPAKCECVVRIFYTRSSYCALTIFGSTLAPAPAPVMKLRLFLGPMCFAREISVHRVQKIELE